MNTARTPRPAPWTPFVRATLTPAGEQALRASRNGVLPNVYLNSRYQVIAMVFQHPLFGETVHLSVKALDQSASHDWRDFQRIKNELCGPDTEGIEIYPAESRLVDTSNQYHLWVFASWKIPLGFEERLVAEASVAGLADVGTVQRPFEADMRPPDCQTPAALAAKVQSLTPHPPGSGKTTVGG